MTTRLQKGFTLVELLVYAAGLILLVGGIATALFYSYKWYENVTIGPRVDEVGLSLSNKLLMAIRLGDSINAGYSSFNVASGTLMIMTSATTTAKSEYFTLENGRISNSRDGASPIHITPANIFITELRFSEVNSTNSKGVRFEISIPFHSREGTTTRSYKGFAVMRQSY